MQSNFYGKYQNSRDTTWRLLLKHNINTIPISVAPIIRDLGIKIYSYEEGNTLLEDMNLIDKLKFNEGFSIVNHNKAYIFYNDDIQCKARIRFTVAHELGHLILGHYNNKSKYEETEANIFASRLLAPACLIWGLQIHDAESLVEIFGLSKQSAQIRYERMEKLYKKDYEFFVRRGYGTFLSHPLERQVYNQFKPALNNILQNR